MSAQDNTAARLKAIVQVLAEEPGTPVKGSDVLAAAVARMPLSAWESEVLSGGVARGVKRLSAATATLVKEGLILKGRTGWTITEEGSRYAAAPGAVALAGNFGHRLGTEDWAPAADQVQMAYSPVSQSWELTAQLPAGTYEFKVAIDRSWEENYGAFGISNGANHVLQHDGGVVTFRYDHRSKDVEVTVLDGALV
ncbi:hypothetical protein P4U43_03870 [Arthrobacter sp. EH-1B-1]|uniref:Amylopullulanase X25 domain-containing protein n=1 Tax=Arthrobacter vasquezii TaxID=2977629 RepID=A0ABT6CS66_9MICC|nr:hypothetical protein [Arthrobacter vasquezii]MDF9276926.1 hypothetical protein [Arthrobacter vasquezii]